MVHSVEDQGQAGAVLLVDQDGTVKVALPHRARVLSAGDGADNDPLQLQAALDAQEADLDFGTDFQTCLLVSSLRDSTAVHEHEWKGRAATDHHLDGDVAKHIFSNVILSARNRATTRQGEDRVMNMTHTRTDTLSETYETTDDQESEPQPTQERGGALIAVREVSNFSCRATQPNRCSMLTPMRVRVTRAQSALTQPLPSLSHPAHLAESVDGDEGDEGDVELQSGARTEVELSPRDQDEPLPARTGAAATGSPPSPSVGIPASGAGRANANASSLHVVAWLTSYTDVISCADH